MLAVWVRVDILRYDSWLAFCCAVLYTVKGTFAWPIAGKHTPGRSHHVCRFLPCSHSSFSAESPVGLRSAPRTSQTCRLQLSSVRLARSALSQCACPRWSMREGAQLLTQVAGYPPIFCQPGQLSTMDALHGELRPLKKGSM